MIPSTIPGVWPHPMAEIARAAWDAAQRHDWIRNGYGGGYCSHCGVSYDPGRERGECS